ncbi:MAG: oligosaccharide flippase family protein [Methyloprofundus sp.]|nr:oligosaccharide flippase family protein [Methyloprofundus sp.]
MPKLNKSFITTIATVLIPISMQFIYIRYVSYEVDKTIYGNFILLQTLIAGLSYIFLQIPSQAYTRFYNTQEDKQKFINEFRTLLIFINILCFFVIMLYGSMMQKFSLSILLTIFIYFVFLNNYAFNQNIFLLNMERGKYFYLKVFEATAKFVLPIIFYYLNETLFSFLLGLCTGYAISFCVLMFFLKDYKFYFIINIKNLNKYFKFAYPIFFVSIFSWAISLADRYFIEFFNGTEQVATYAILAQVAGIGQIVGQIYTLHVNPKALKMFEDDKKSALEYLSKILKKLGLVFILLSVLAYLLPVQIYEILLDPEIIEQPYYFITFFILLIGIFITVYQTAYSMYLNLFKKLNILAYIYFIAFIFNLLGNFFIKKYGMIAAAISTLLAYTIILSGQIIYIKYTKALTK